MYEIWDMVSGNLVEDFRDEAEALAWVKDALDLDGTEYVRGIALMVPRADGRYLVADGDELARRTTEVPVPKE